MTTTTLVRGSAWVMQPGIAGVQQPGTVKAPSAPPPADRDVIAEFRRYQELRGLSANTLRVRDLVLRGFERDVGPLFTATVDDVERFLSSRRSMSAQTRRSYLCHLRAFYLWARRNKLTRYDPTEDIELPKVPKRKPRPIGDDDLALVLGAADDQMRAWLLLGTLAGLRCAEIAGISRDDVREDTGELWIVGKGDKERVVPLHPLVWTALRSAGLRDSGPLWLSPKTGRPYSPGRVSQKVADHMRRRGVNSTAHKLRHWFASALARDGVDLLVISDLLGHESTETTRVYTRLYRPAAVTAIGALSVG